MDLQPPPSVQKELYKLYSVLIQIVQASPDVFSVVGPHDFIEALSWSDTVGAQGAQVVRRLREQTFSPGWRKKLLVPFSLNEAVFLVVVDLHALVIQIFDQRTQKDLEKLEKDDGSDTSTFTWTFIKTLFPVECPQMTAWKIHFEKTMQGPIPINPPNIKPVPYLNKFERDFKLRSVLPFFFEAMWVVSGYVARKKVDDDAFLTRLFVEFEGSPHLRNAEVLCRLRQDSQQMLHRSLEGRVKADLEAGDEYLREMAMRMGQPWRSSCTPPEFLHLRFQLKRRALNKVTQSNNATMDLMEQYSYTRFLLEAMTGKCLATKSDLHHNLINSTTAGYYYVADARSEIWRPEAALVRYRVQGLNALAQKLQGMRQELDCWLGMLGEHLDSIRTP